MNANAFALNEPEQMSISIKEMGKTGSPVIVVDDYFRDPLQVRELALGSAYGNTDQYLPGSYSENFHPFAVVSPGLALLLPPDVANGAWSPGRFLNYTLQPSQRFSSAFHVPHVDVNGCSYVMLVYLNLAEQCMGGTAFARHRFVDIDRIPQQPTTDIVEFMVRYGLRNYDEFYHHLLFRRQLFLFEALTAALAGEDVQTYQPEDLARNWEQIGLVEMRFNRALIYDCARFHMPYMESDFTSTNDVRANRLLLRSTLPAAALPVDKIAWAVHAANSAAD